MNFNSYECPGFSMLYAQNCEPTNFRKYPKAKKARFLYKFKDNFVLIEYCKCFQNNEYLYSLLFQLGRYLNRSYWEKRKENAAPPAYTAPTREEEEPPVSTTAYIAEPAGQVCLRFLHQN